LVYFFCWIVLAAGLQKQSRLSNWKPDAILQLGNDASGQNPWRGNLQTLQIWDRPIARDGNAAKKPRETDVREAAAPIIDYDFSTLRNSSSQLRFAPELFWIPVPPASWQGQGAAFDGKSWLSTKTNAGDLVASLRKTNQFAVHLVCSPQDIADAWGRIVYISDSDGIPDLMIRQENAGLGFGIRTPLASKRAQLIWSVPGVFNENQRRDIWYSYDGSNLSLKLDGQRQRLTYRLGPGTALARIIRRVKPAELEGNDYIFYTMVFFVSGVFMGLSASYRGSRFNTLIVLGSFLVFSAVAVSLELILTSVCGRPFSSSHVFLSVGLGIAGLLWTLADNHFRVDRPSIVI
jgi:hypothetical protein